MNKKILLSLALLSLGQVEAGILPKDLASVRSMGLEYFKVGVNSSKTMLNRVIAYRAGLIEGAKKVALNTIRKPTKNEALVAGAITIGICQIIAYSKKVKQLEHIIKSLSDIACSLREQNYKSGWSQKRTVELTPETLNVPASILAEKSNPAAGIECRDQKV